MRSFLNKSILSAIALAAISGTAFAQVTLPPGASAVPIPDVVLASPPFAGTLVDAQQSGFTAFGGTINATLLSAVYRVGGGPGVGTLDFYYQVINTSSSFTIATGGVNSFSGAVIQVGQSNENIDGAGTGINGVNFVATGASIFNEAARGIAPGPDVNFSFLPGTFTSGTTSNIFFVRTNAVAFSTVGSFALQSGGIVAGASGPVLAAVPAVGVPEANAGLLVGLALPLLGGIAILRRKKN